MRPAEPCERVVLNLLSQVGHLTGASTLTRAGSIVFSPDGDARKSGVGSKLGAASRARQVATVIP